MSYILGAAVVLLLAGVLGFLGYVAWKLYRGEVPEAPDDTIDRLRK